MRPPRAPKIILCLLFFTGLAGAETPCEKAAAAWRSVNSYRCTYRAVTEHEGKVKVSMMVYSFQKPGKVRMDIAKPRKGAVLIYNPEVSEKVKVRPFPGVKSFALSYALTDKKVSSGSGGTIDRSDLGHKIETVCAEPQAPGRRVTFDKSGFLNRVEELDSNGRTLESFEWKDLEINPELPEKTFTDF